MVRRTSESSSRRSVRSARSVRGSNAMEDRSAARAQRREDAYYEYEERRSASYRAQPAEQEADAQETRRARSQEPAPRRAAPRRQEPVQEPITPQEMGETRKFGTAEVREAAQKTGSPAPVAEQEAPAPRAAAAPAAFWGQAADEQDVQDARQAVNTFGRRRPTQPDADEEDRRQGIFGDQGDDMPIPPPPVATVEYVEEPEGDTVTARVVPTAP
ncbi:MAG: hypothetical protein PHD32_07490, partial [Eubacteriales bacterium]|nr:hypothetical protein [Eubacteriales bacterium]